MTKTKTLSKKKKDNVNSEFSKTLLQRIMVSPPLMALLPGVRPIKMAALRIGETFKAQVHQALVTRQSMSPVTGHQSPFTEYSTSDTCHQSLGTSQ